MKTISLAKGIYRHLSLPKAPIVVGGCERSGTTLLHRVIGAHPEVVAIPNETWSLCHAENAGFAGRPVRLSQLFYSLGRVPSEEFQRRPKRWAEKSPANIYCFDEIRRAFGGNVRLIQIVRDGRDVVTSTHATLKSDRPLVSVRRWIASVDAGLRYLEDDSVLTVRYEDLIESFDEQIARICAFLGYNEVPDQMRLWTEYTTVKEHHSGPVKPVFTTSVGKWRKATGEAKERVDSLINNRRAVELLSALGYQ